MFSFLGRQAELESQKCGDNLAARSGQNLLADYFKPLGDILPCGGSIKRNKMGYGLHGFVDSSMMLLQQQKRDSCWDQNCTGDH